MVDLKTEVFGSSGETRETSEVCVEKRARERGRERVWKAGDNL